MRPRDPLREAEIEIAALNQKIASAEHELATANNYRNSDHKALVKTRNANKLLSAAMSDAILTRLYKW